MLATDLSYVPSKLILTNGACFSGYSPNWFQGEKTGEVVFSTGMTGYPESLTDPSFAGQILTFTYPQIGNYGVPARSQWESFKIHLEGVVLGEICEQWSHCEGILSLSDWLHSQNIPVIIGIDTRALTKILRASGTMRGILTTGEKGEFTHDNTHLVSKVSVTEKTTHSNGEKVVIAVDCGMKESIISSLLQFPITLIRVPHDYDYSEEKFDGVFLSNGPGDPIQCTKTIAILQKAMQKGKPIFGICLGAQLLALAANAKTYKLPFGHRGQNQPCIELETKKLFITSQNHGYAIDEHSLTSDWKVTFKNLNDGSIEGISHVSKPFSCVQFHPEASPGPFDTKWLFEKFYQSLFYAKN